MNHLGAKLRPVASSFAIKGHKAAELKGSCRTTLVFSRLPNGLSLALVLSLYDGEASLRVLPKSYCKRAPNGLSGSQAPPCGLLICNYRSQSSEAYGHLMDDFGHFSNGLTLARVLSLFDGGISPKELPKTSPWKLQNRFGATLSAIRTY